jgi:Fungal protein kinase
LSTVYQSKFALAHQSLYDYGILHRDVSIGNVFISDDPDNSHGVAGFLGDLDMAKVYDPNKLATEIPLEEAERLVKMTGSGTVTVMRASIYTFFLLTAGPRAQRSSCPYPFYLILPQTKS